MVKPSIALSLSGERLRLRIALSILALKVMDAVLTFRVFALIGKQLLNLPKLIFGKQRERRRGIAVVQMD